MKYLTDRDISVAMLRELDGALGRVGVGVEEKRPLPADPWEFATECCWTLDEQAAAEGQEEVRRFPRYEYLRLLMREVDANPFTWIVKSGQLMVSWLLQAYYLWCVLTKRGYRLAYYCLSQSKAEGHIRSRFLRLYDRIPRDRWAVPYARLLGGHFFVYHDGPDSLPTSFIVAMAAEQGARDDAAAKMRSETWTRVLLDESAFYPNLEELHNSLTPRTTGITHVSTPNGHNFFEKIGLGDITKPNQRALVFELIENVEKPMDGVWLWNRNGFRCIRVTYRAHPLRNPDLSEAGKRWFESRFQVTTPRLWSREQECSFEVAANAPVYETGGNLVVAGTCFNPDYPVLRGWDFGHRFPFVVFGQVLPFEENGRTVYRLEVHYELTRQGITTEDLARLVKVESAKLFPNAEFVDGCDYYGGNQVRSNSPRSDVQILNSHGIYPIYRASQVKLGVEIIQQLINERRLVINSDLCPFVLTALRTGYVRGDDGELPTEKEKEKQHPFCDAADALRYMAQLAFHIGTMAPTEYVTRRTARPTVVPGMSVAPVWSSGSYFAPLPNVRRPVSIGVDARGGVRRYMPMGRPLWYVGRKQSGLFAGRFR